MTRPSPRLYVSHALAQEAAVRLDETQSHYVQQVMRLKIGDAVRLFNGQDGEWQATLTHTDKRSCSLSCTHQTRAQQPSPDMMVCFAPPRGGRIDSIIEKATELGAKWMQPVRCERSVVDKINPEKWELAMREAAEQSERLDVPTLLPMQPFEAWLAAWDATRTLVFGDETGAAPRFDASQMKPTRWAVMTGPEGGFAPHELHAMRQLQGSYGVSLGPRILRTDTAVITLCALTQAAWGDWHLLPRFAPDNHTPRQPHPDTKAHA